MKKLLIILLSCTTVQMLFAQSPDKSVEIHLSLLQKSDETGVKELALSVSMVNHSDKDIYIPNFEFFASYSGIHFYQKEGKSWREISVESHDYVRPVLPVQTASGKTVRQNEPFFYYNENSITKQYKNHMDISIAHQDSIIKTYYNSENDHHELSIFTLKEEKPLFLKAKKTLDDYFIRNLDYPCLAQVCSPVQVRLCTCAFHLR